MLHVLRKGSREMRKMAALSSSYPLQIPPGAFQSMINVTQNSQHADVDRRAFTERNSSTLILRQGQRRFHRRELSAFLKLTCACRKSRAIRIHAGDLRTRVGEI
ncbi:hypothetical protein BaRGS_00027676, partial [Batillaria attramentaria]